MARACEKCGAPAADDQSLFCNRCGGAVTEVPDPHLPVCKKCGFPAPDAASEFCTRCGSKFRDEPQARYPVCRNCGHEIPDEQAGFCNRCGTPARGPGVAGVAGTTGQAPGPVVPVRKKHELTKETAADWTPWSDTGEPAGTPAAPAPSKKRTRLPVGPEPEGDGNGMSGNGSTGHARKYAHLPLVADELKGLKPEPAALLPETGAGKPAKKDGAGKRGLMSFFKRKP